MANKTLSELLNKYNPPEKYADILSSATVTRSRVDKEHRMLEVYADFPTTLKKDTLYDIEAQVTEAYKLNLFKIFSLIEGSNFASSKAIALLTCSALFLASS